MSLKSPLPRSHPWVVHVAQSVGRPAPHFEINAPDILAHETNSERQNADEDEENREQRKHAFALRADDQAAHEEKPAEADAAESDDDAGEAYDLDRKQRK